MPPDPDAIARAFMEAELAKDRPKADVASESRHPEPISAVSSQAEVDAYLSSLDKQVAGGNLLTPFTRPNPRLCNKLSRPLLCQGRALRPRPFLRFRTIQKNRSRQRQLRHQQSSKWKRPAAEAERFVFRQLGKGKKVRYRAADGSVYEIAKTAKSSGGSAYRITKEGDPAIATITKTEILQRGQAEHWGPKANLTNQQLRKRLLKYLSHQELLSKETKSPQRPPLKKRARNQGSQFLAKPKQLRNPSHQKLSQRSQYANNHPERRSRLLSRVAFMFQRTRLLWLI